MNTVVFQVANLERRVDALPHGADVVKRVIRQKLLIEGTRFAEEIEPGIWSRDLVWGNGLKVAFAFRIEAEEAIVMSVIVLPDTV